MLYQKVLPYHDCVALLGATQVGRVVFTLGALPAIVPVTFAVQRDALIVFTTADTQVAGAANRGVIAFEVDDVDPVTRTGWSVVVTGIAETVTDPCERARIHADSAPWIPGPNDVLIRLPFTLVAGRRILASPLTAVTAS
jgi:uncharacterized protein